MRLRELCAIRNPSEQALIESLLMWHGIEYLIHNDHFGSLEVGPIIPLFNQKTVLVGPEDLPAARELLREGMRSDREPESKATARLSGRLRPFLETLFFGWFIPGRRRKAADVE